MQNDKTKKLTLLAVLTALSVTFGFVAKIPTPTGLLTLVDAGIYFTAFYLGKKEGATVGGLSAFLIDLLSSAPQWMFISLLIHGAQGYFAGFKGKYRIVGLLLATIAMVGGYALASIFMYGIGSAVAEIIPNFCQNALGLVVGWVLYQGFKKVQSKIG
ncbi:ECF transporter S component [uncultured Streptococcus sp.]|uniref:ECF transporter S component n=1 Tax=uncultured Streptococcus sp. TaxID=83427 RepID=UPI0025F8F273|nr:ECF transporter S component [uncultured Streptococcus sp.]